MDKELTLSPSQMDFVQADEDFVVFCGGIGSGKTHAGAVWASQMILQHLGTGVIGIITANSHSQLQKATLPKLFEILEDIDVPYEFKKQSGEIWVCGMLAAYAKSMEKYDDVRGIETGWVWSDECAFYREEAFQVLIGRIRDKNGPCQWKGTTTPNGYNWLYKTFVSNPLASSRIIYGKTLDNALNLGSSYIDNLRNQYDERMAKQELEGKFVNLNSGLVYYNFDREKFLGETDSSYRNVIIGLDFNVHPLCAVCCYEKDGVLFVEDEIYLENSNTPAVAREIAKKFPYRYVDIVCDDTGNRRKTSSETTDHEILRRAGFNVLKFKNPHVKDRYNNMNRLFYQDRVVINNKCKKLTEDLEQLIYDNKDPMLSHISDALGYVAWYLDPLQKPKRRATIKTK